MVGTWSPQIVEFKRQQRARLWTVHNNKRHLDGDIILIVPKKEVIQNEIENAITIFNL